MLTHEEQIIWKLIRENGYFWYGDWHDGIFEWLVEEDNFIFERLREHWESVKLVASEEKLKSDLPFWNKSKKDDDINHINAIRKKFDPSDNDIPF